MNEANRVEPGTAFAPAEIAEIASSDEAGLTTVRGLTALRRQPAEELRTHFITPEYLSELRRRVKDWSDEGLKDQHRYFHHTIPDYPEVIEVLELELHTRDLNRLRRTIRGKPVPELQAFLKKYGAEPDYAEVIQTELEIRQGARRLRDSSDGRTQLLT